MNNEQSKAATLEFSSAVLTEAEERIQSALDNDSRVTKAVLTSEITKSLGGMPCASEALVYALLTNYVDGRDDLEVGKGPQGGVGAKGWKPVANEADATVLQSAEDILQSTPFGKYITVATVARMAAAKTPENDQIRAAQVITKAWKGRTDLDTRKGPQGGVSRKAPASEEAATEETPAV